MRSIRKVKVIQVSHPSLKGEACENKPEVVQGER